MKKLILSVAAVTCAVLSFGQTSTTTTTTVTTTETVEVDEKHQGDYKSVYLGGRVLATVTSLRVKSIDNNTVSTGFLVGYGGGGVIGANFSKHFAVQAEVLYSALAQKYKDGNISRKLNITYLNVPLLLVLNTNVSRPVNFNICAGPQVGINTGSSLKTESTDEDNVDTVQAVLAVKSGDLGIAYGAGLDFMLGETVKMSLGFRGVQGLVDISDKSESTVNNEYYILDRAHVNTWSGYAGLAVCF